MNSSADYFLRCSHAIGKSIFLIYSLLYRLERRLPTAIELMGYDLILFSAGGVTVHNPKRDSWCLPEDCWALSDSNACVSHPCQAFRISGAPRVIQTMPPEPHTIGRKSGASRWVPV